jgi:hypothetical protein
MIVETQFLLALVTTWVIEIPILVVLIRYFFHQDNLPIARIISIGALCTALTLPYLWFILPWYLDVWYIPVGETLVALMEALILNKFLELNPKTALICSIVMNAASYGLGSFLL